MELPRPSGLITLLTDYGTRDPYVGIVKGTIKQRFARAEIVDLCHDTPPQAIEVGALFLGGAVGRFPPGTVHIAIVDPGVGTDRRVLVACCAACYWVGPDNGLLDPALGSAARPAEVRVVQDLTALRLQPQSATFWGRDVFGPLGALLAANRVGFRAVGPRVDDAVRLPSGGSPRVVAIDHFGNLLTNVHATELAARAVQQVGVRDRQLPLVRCYADAPPGTLLALVNSYDLLEIAIAGGSAADVLGVKLGEPVVLGWSA